MRDPGEANDVSAIRARAWRRFDAGDFPGALAAFGALRDLGALGASDRDALIELLIDKGEIEHAVDLLDDAIARRGEGVGDPDSVTLLLRRFDLSARLGSGGSRTAEAAMRLLEALAASGGTARWAAAVTPERLGLIEQSLESPSALLDAFEQFAYAPAETGLPELARARIEAIGLGGADNLPVARAAERLLHALGDAAAGYRVEQARKDALRRQSVASRHDPAEEPGAGTSLTGLRVVLAGGHPALRSVIERDLVRAGVAGVRSIPSAKEASRTGRDVRAAVAGCDVVVLLVRQLAHSTEAQVRQAAAQHGVPVIIAESAGIGAVRRTLARFAAERGA